MLDDLVTLEVLQPRFRIEILDLRSDQDLEVFERETPDFGHPALAGFDAGPELGYVETDRRNGAQSGDYNAPTVITERHI